MTQGQLRRPRRWYVLSGAAGVVAVLLAVGVPWTMSGLHDDSAPPPASDSPAPGGRIVARQGPAVELVAASNVPARRDPSQATPVATSEQAFALALLQKMSATGNGVAVSPASLAIALAMLQNGARGRTLREISVALHSSGLSSADQNAGWAALSEAWESAAVSDGFSLATANSLWAQRDLPITAQFLTALQRSFGRGVWQVDFAHDRAAAAAAINQWTAQHTKGRITKLVTDLPAETQAVLANATYFKAAWRQPFDPRDTHDGEFLTTSGPRRASFMNATTNLAASVTPEYAAVQLPYRGRRFAALAIMPTASLGDLIARLDAASLNRIVSGLGQQPVALRMPRFTMSSTLDLNPPLRQLGLATALGDGADFSALSSRPLKVLQVVQRVYLAVAEKGTEAAAATGIVMVPTSARANVTDISLDHPFLFLIRDVKTGAILFASEVQHPTV